MKSPERHPAQAGETSMNTEALLKERYLKPIEVARLLRVSRTTVYNWMSIGLLPSTQYKPFRVRASAVLRFMAEDLRS